MAQNIVVHGFGSSGGGGGGLTAIATPQDSTTVRVTFSAPVIDNAVLRYTGAYEFNPPLTVTAVNPENVVTPDWIDLTVSEMKQGQSYTLTIHTISAA